MIGVEALGIEVTSGQLTLGAISGMTLGILAVGLVLVYRSSKIVNFAHGEIGAFGAAVCGVLVVRWGFPYYLALAAGLVISALTGAATELVVVRRLRKAPTLMSVVATLGVGELLSACSLLVNAEARATNKYPKPPGLPEFTVGTALVTQAYSGMLLLAPVVVVGLVVFLRRSRVGLALQAAAANPERARLLGISAARMSTLAWALAGALSAFTVALLLPTRGFTSADILGPSLLLRALAACVIARMTSLPVALLAGVVLGVVDQTLIFNYPASGVSEVVLLGIIAGALLFQRARAGRREERQDWARLQPWPALDERQRSVWAIRNLGAITGVIALVAAAIVGYLCSNATAVTLVAIVAMSMIGLSVGIVTGLGGQLSLGHFALAGVGAVLSYLTVDGTGNYVLGLLAAAVGTALAAGVLGLPALRVRGLMLGVLTLSFALAAQRWLLGQSWALGSGANPGRPTLGSVDFRTTREYFVWAVVALLIAFWFARNVWRGALGLRLRATRDNEDAARAFGISPTRVKLQGFAVSGALAGVGGAVYGHLLSRISAQTFDVNTSIKVVALTVLGGAGLLCGPLLGALYIVGVPELVPLDNAGLAASALGWLVLILYFPGGVAQLVAMPRQVLISWLSRRAGLEDRPADRAPDVAGESISRHGVSLESLRRTRAPLPSGEVLVATGLTKNYGGIRAVDRVDLSLHAGEILGLIGANGAGKTSLFELIGGFAEHDAGRVTLLGEDITNWPAHRRARAGLVRSFQDAALFPSLTVLETVSLALEKADPTNLALSCAGVRRSERRRQDQAAELVRFMGLERYRDRQVRELSTGTRRIADLACLVALQPAVLLLDEPSSGIAQRESEALGELLLRLRDVLGCSMIVIEHDVPLLMGMSDRVMAMDTGRVVAVGSPDEVCAHPEVVAAYLGADTVAIERSGSGDVARARPQAATTR